MAVDLGGTNFRVLSVSLRGKESLPSIIDRSYSVPQEIQRSTGEEVSGRTNYAFNLLAINFKSII